MQIHRYTLKRIKVQNFNLIFKNDRYNHIYDYYFIYFYHYRAGGQGERGYGGKGGGGRG